MTDSSCFERAKLALTVASISQLPAPGAGEVAFAGRSNAGKSSAINVLVRQKRLAFVAKTPGKTRTIQFYSLEQAGFLVDLPGYGYAKVSESQRRQWHTVLENYLAKRDSLRGLVLLMDIRHPLTSLDRQMLEWFAPRGLPMHILLTKSDKISRAAAATTLQRVRAELASGGFAASVQLFSSLHRTGTDGVRSIVASWLGIPLNPGVCSSRTAQIKTPGSRGAPTGGKVP